jgi:hypothetical protein
VDGSGPTVKIGADSLSRSRGALGLLAKHAGRQPQNSDRARSLHFTQNVSTIFPMQTEFAGRTHCLGESLPSGYLPAAGFRGAIVCSGRT